MRPGKTGKSGRTAKRIALVVTATALAAGGFWAMRGDFGGAVTAHDVIWSGPTK